jgi:heme A synthase
MKKFLNWFSLGAMIGWAAVFIYHIFTLPCNDVAHYVGSFLLSGAFFILNVMTEDRPLKTRKQKDYNHDIQMTGMTTLLLMSVVCVICLMFSSCSTKKGYGCHGNESWNGMIKRINKP